MDVVTLSLPPMLRLWQVLQLMMWLRDRRGSNHSLWPSTAWSRLMVLPRTSVTCSGMGWKMALARLRSSSAWAVPASSNRPPSRIGSGALIRGSLELVLAGSRKPLFVERRVDLNQAGRNFVRQRSISLLLNVSRAFGERLGPTEASWRTSRRALVRQGECRSDQPCSWAMPTPEWRQPSW